MPFSDKIKDTAAKATEAATKAAQAATEKAAELAVEHGDKVAAGAGTLVEKAGSVVDAKTGGKYAEHIEKAKGAVVDGVTKGTEKIADKATAPTADASVETPVVTGGEHEHHTDVKTEDRNF